MKYICNDLKTPYYIVDKALLQRNLDILDDVQKRSGCEILLALKGFSMYSTFPQIGSCLAGITASSLNEAKLGYEEMGKQVHIFAPAYREDEFDEILQICDHMVFNTFAQYDKFKSRVKNSGRDIEVGIRINPEYSEIETDMYNPCFTNSRLGTVLSQFEEGDIDGVDGLHFHAMCEQNSDTLSRILDVVEEKFGKYLHQMKWVNFGGGHHITRADYNIDLLVESIIRIRDKYDVKVYLEPGEAIALNTGFLVTSVMDVLKNNMDLAIIDASAACHMPDVLEMPYRPEIIGAQLPSALPYTYRLGGNTCLAGDVIGDYSFSYPLKPGDKLVFTDMAHYTMVKNNTFNGINLPSIAIYDDGDITLVKEFGYEDFKRRL
ncbi:MAG: carboxynorspermidine decarboxylase [Eubacteriales bacterium]